MYELLQELPVAGIAVPPYLHQEPIRVHRAASIGEQHLQQPQLEVREPHRYASADSDGVLIDVERDMPHGQRRRAFNPGAAQQRLDAREERARTEGLV